MRGFGGGEGFDVVGEGPALLFGEVSPGDHEGDAGGAFGDDAEDLFEGATVAELAFGEVCGSDEEGARGGPIAFSGGAVAAHAELVVDLFAEGMEFGGVCRGFEGCELDFVGVAVPLAGEERERGDERAEEEDGGGVGSVQGEWAQRGAGAALREVGAGASRRGAGASRRAAGAA